MRPTLLLALALALCSLTACLDDGSTVGDPDDDESLVSEPDTEAAALVCGRLVDDWYAVSVRHTGRWCRADDGYCYNYSWYQTEAVTCENTCKTPGVWTCATLGSAGHPGHLTTRPTTLPDVSCEIPCNGMSQCSGCVFRN